MNFIYKHVVFFSLFFLFFLLLTQMVDTTETY